MSQITVTLSPSNPKLDIPANIAAGASFLWDWNCDDVADWGLYDLACDVRDMDGTLMFRVTSDDDEITVGSPTTQLLMTWPPEKTGLLEPLTQYKFDVIGTQIADATIQLLAWPYSTFTTIERVTE